MENRKIDTTKRGGFMALTNEQLAELIQEDNEDLKPVLWERIKKLLYMFADKYYKSYTDYCSRCGVDAWDLKQQAYKAYENSLKGYSRSRGAYSTYISFMFKNVIRELFSSKEPLNTADSLDRPVDTEDESGGTLSELIPDPTAEEAFEKIEDSSVATVVRSAVEKLPDRERNIIKMRYFDGLSRPRISADMGISSARVHQIEATALSKLHKNKDIRRLGDELGYTSYKVYNNTLSGFNKYGISNVERMAIERADIEMRLNGGSFEESAKNAEEYTEGLWNKFLEEEANSVVTSFDKLCEEIKRTQRFDLAAFKKACEENRSQAIANIKSFYLKDEGSANRISIWD